MVRISWFEQYKRRVVIYIKKIVIGAISALLIFAAIIIALYNYNDIHYVATLETINGDTIIKYDGIEYVYYGNWGFDFCQSLGELNKYQQNEKRIFFDFPDEVASIKGDDNRDFISRQMSDGPVLFCRPEIRSKLNTVNYNNFYPTEITLRNVDKVIRLKNKNEISKITDLELLKGELITFDGTSLNKQTYWIGYNPLDLPIYKPVGFITYVDNKYLYVKYNNSDSKIEKGYEIDNITKDLLLSKFK